MNVLISVLITAGTAAFIVYTLETKGFFDWIQRRYKWRCDWCFSSHWSLIVCTVAGYVLPLTIVPEWNLIANALLFWPLVTVATHLIVKALHY